MHDKMNYAKIASLVFSHKSKQLDELTKLPVLVTGMIAHRYGDVRYAHYGHDIFMYYSNYIVGSLAKLLRDLELPLTYSSRKLFIWLESIPLFEVVLKRAKMYKILL